MTCVVGAAAYGTGPETISDAPSEEIMKMVHEIPGSRGLYVLHERNRQRPVHHAEGFRRIHDRQPGDGEQASGQRPALLKTEILAVEESKSRSAVSRSEHPGEAGWDGVEWPR